jgi:hypothetical protein
MLNGYAEPRGTSQGKHVQEKDTLLPLKHDKCERKNCGVINGLAGDGVVVSVAQGKQTQTKQ